MVLNCLQPTQDMEQYRLIINTHNKVTIAILKRAHNIQTITDALVYNQTQTYKLSTKVQPTQLLTLNNMDAHSCRRYFTLNWKTPIPQYTTY